MKGVRCITDKIRSEDIRKKLKIMSIWVKIRKYRTQWKEHLEQMNRNCIEQQCSTIPKGKGTEEGLEKEWARYRLIAFNHDGQNDDDILMLLDCSKYNDMKTYFCHAENMQLTEYDMNAIHNLSTGLHKKNWVY